MNIQPVWQPVGCLFTRYSQLYKRFDNQLFRVNGVLNYSVCKKTLYALWKISSFQHSLDADYCCRQPTLLLALQCFDTVDWVIWPVKPIPDMTYNVFSVTLNQSIRPSQHADQHTPLQSGIYKRAALGHKSKTFLRCSGFLVSCNNRSAAFNVMWLVVPCRSQWKQTAGAFL